MLLAGGTWTATLAALLAAVTADPIPGCTLSVVPAPTGTVQITGRATGLLNGMNLTNPADDTIAAIRPQMWRGPIANWLWPNRSSCNGPGTCCTPESCLPPFREATRISKLGMRQQYILSGIHTGMGSCEWESFNRKPHQCSLPGGPSDANFSGWITSIESAVNQAKRQNLVDVGFDVWNEPNAQEKVQCLATDACPFDANLTASAFYEIWDVAQKTIKTSLPSARVIGPSISDGGPGIDGFGSVLPWLQGFLRHTHAAGTLPDVLTWHVSTVGSNGTLLLDHHADLRSWANAEGIPLPLIGHNEVVGPQATLEPAANVGFIAALEELKVDHACRACWTDPVTKQSPCWDNSLDALLTDDCSSDHPLNPDCDRLQTRAVYYPYKWYAELAGRPTAVVRAAPRCGGNLVGFAAGSSDHANASIVIGRFAQPEATASMNITVTIATEMFPAAAKSCVVHVEHVSVGSAGDTARDPATPIVNPAAIATVDTEIGHVTFVLTNVPLRDAFRLDVASCQ